MEFVLRGAAAALLVTIGLQNTANAALDYYDSYEEAIKHEAAESCVVYVNIGSGIGSRDEIKFQVQQWDSSTFELASKLLEIGAATGKIFKDGAGRDVIEIAPTAETQKYIVSGTNRLCLAKYKINKIISAKDKGFEFIESLEVRVVRGPDETTMPPFFDAIKDLKAVKAKAGELKEGEFTYTVDNSRDGWWVHAGVDLSEW